MALIFLEELKVLTFSKSDCLDFIATDEWPQFTQPQSTGLWGSGQCWSLNTSCNRSKKQFPGLKMNFS